jgi:hypothetical protein
MYTGIGVAIDACPMPIFGGGSGRRGIATGIEVPWRTKSGLNDRTERKKMMALLAAAKARGVALGPEGQRVAGCASHLAGPTEESTDG